MIAPRSARPVLVPMMLLLIVAGCAMAQQRTILAIGAHAADMELTAGALLAHQKKLGDRVVLLHMTLGEAGNPKLAPQLYAGQKRREAEAAARDLGAELIIGPYQDAMLPNDEESRKYVADVIRQVKPTYVITHWKNGFHKDHRNTYAIVVDAVFMAGLEAVKTPHSPYDGVRQIYYAENWEDAEAFQPYIYVDVSDVFAEWEKAVREYQLVRGGISPFPYFQFYTSLEGMRGALMRTQRAVAFDIDEPAKKVVLSQLQ